MEKTKKEMFEEILAGELVQALGCTEPIAIAYAGARVRALLGQMPERVIARCSTNIIKNAKSVSVPNTGGRQGIEAAVLAGIVGGDPEAGLEVLTGLDDAGRDRLAQAIAAHIVQVVKLESPLKLDIEIEAFAGEDQALVRISREHTHITKEIHNGRVIRDTWQEVAEGNAEEVQDFALNEAVDFALEGDLSGIIPFLDRQLDSNTAIAQEGLAGNYGAKIGKHWLDLYGQDTSSRAIASAAAGSDARMAGCSLPVVIVSGSGNQGMTASVPVIVYAQDLDIPKEKLYRALALSNLLAIYQKQNIGRLSAYCGAVNAASGAAAAICWLQGGTRDQLLKAMEYVLATMSGLVCDGAKGSCAAKIASVLQAAVMGANLALEGVGFQAGDGIVKDSPAKTVESVVTLAKDGMKETDDVIVDIMLKE